MSEPPPPAKDSSVSARQLRNLLKAARIKSGMTQREVAKATYWSASKVIRMESGTVSVSVTDARALVELYGVPEPRRSEIIALAQAAKEKSEWAAYAEFVNPATMQLVASEADAAVLSSFQPVLVPGVLQTEQYTESILRYLRGPKSEERTQAYVELRAQRMERLLRDNGVRQLKFVLDESVIRRCVGGPEVMEHQLRRLLEVSELPFLTLRVVPFELGIYRSIRVPFVVLEFPRPQDEDLLYLEYPQRDEIVRPKDVNPREKNPTAPSTYLEIFAGLEELTSAEQTQALLLDAVADMQRRRGLPPDPAPTEPPSEP